MKRLLILLGLLLALTGCGGQPEYTVRSSAPEKAVHLSEAVAVRPVPPTLMDQAIPVEGCQGLYEIPTQALEGMSYPSMMLFDGQLLFFSHEYNMETEQSEIMLMTMNCFTGQATAQAGFPVEGYVFPQVRGDRVYLCDNILGYVKCLDRQLNLIEEHTLDLQGTQWLVNADGTQLYRMEYGGDCQVLDLSTGQGEVYDAGTDVYGLFSTDRSDHHAFVSYVGGPELLECTGSLDLATGALEECPFGSAVSSVTRQGDRWLGYRFDGAYSYHDGRQSWVVSPPDDHDLLLVRDTGHLLVRNYSDRHVMLCDTDGSYLDEFTLDLPSGAFPSDDLTWSVFYQGYFISASNHDGVCQLLLWQPGDKEGYDLELVTEAEHDGPPAGSVVAPELYERAAALSEKYGMEILIAEQCGTVYSDYTTVQITNEDDISMALDTLDAAFSQYPEGFFSQLCYGTIRKVQIHLSGALTGTENHEMSSAGAFTQPVGDVYLMVMDIYQYQLEANFHHELSHIIDHNLEWHTGYEETLFSEDVWRSLSPEGADYSYSYGYWPPSYDEVAQGYFVDDYSRTYPTEDRARIFEYVMSDWDYVFEDNPAIREKLDYYARCIRDCFNTEGWPEVTPWEEPLQED